MDGRCLARLPISMLRRELSKEVKQSYYQAHREVVIARTKAHAAANPEKHAAYAKAWRQRNPDKVFAKRLRERFNLTVEQFEAMRREQDNKCPICNRTFTDTPHVDHDHACCNKATSCGKCVRGLLCRSCNTALGKLQDSVERLRAAIVYLERFYGSRAL